MKSYRIRAAHVCVCAESPDEILLAVQHDVAECLPLSDSLSHLIVGDLPACDPHSAVNDFVKENAAPINFSKTIRLWRYKESVVVGAFSDAAEEFLFSLNWWLMEKKRRLAFLSCLNVLKISSRYMARFSNVSRSCLISKLSRFLTCALEENCNKLLQIDIRAKFVFSHAEQLPLAAKPEPSAEAAPEPIAKVAPPEPGPSAPAEPSATKITFKRSPRTIESIIKLCETIHPFALLLRSDDVITPEDTIQILEEAKFQSDLRTPLGVLENKRCIHCWDISSQECSSCGLWHLCTRCSAELEGNCVQCLFDDQVAAADAAIARRAISFEEAL